MRLASMILSAPLVSVPTAHAAETALTGEIVVDKPYSFLLGAHRVYLFGVDSVETGQTCTIDRQSWDCWAAAQRQLETILSEGEVNCIPTTQPDIELRVIAVCSVNGEDVGERFVRSGFAITIPAETDRYEATQTDARDRAVGLWQGLFTPPSVWRALPMRPKSGRPAFNPG